MDLRKEHPWGGRKLARRLREIGVTGVPAPNELWQMNFKGHVAMEPICGPRGRCHPLTVLDDHSRYSLGLIACVNETDATVRGYLTDIVRRYGLPQAMLSDSGSPWGGSGSRGYTALEV